MFFCSQVENLHAGLDRLKALRFRSLGLQVGGGSCRRQDPNEPHSHNHSEKEGTMHVLQLHLLL